MQNDFSIQMNNKYTTINFERTEGGANDGGLQRINLFNNILGQFMPVCILEMEMNLSEREKLIKRIFEGEIMAIQRAKGADYSGDKDAMSNLRDFGSMGIIVRLGDKYHRLKNFTKSGKLHVKDESVEDTLKDLIIYGFLGLIMYREEQQEVKENPIKAFTFSAYHESLASKAAIKVFKDKGER